MSAISLQPTFFNMQNQSMTSRILKRWQDTVLKNMQAEALTSMLLIFQTKTFNTSPLPEPSVLHLPQPSTGD